MTLPCRWDENRVGGNPNGRCPLLHRGIVPPAPPVGRSPIGRGCKLQGALPRERWPEHFESLDTNQRIRAKTANEPFGRAMQAWRVIRIRPMKVILERSDGLRLSSGKSALPTTSGQTIIPSLLDELGGAERRDPSPACESPHSFRKGYPMSRPKHPFHIPRIGSHLLERLEKDVSNAFPGSYRDRGSTSIPGA